MAMNDRCKPVTISAELVQELWSEVKSLRDEASSQRHAIEYREAQLNLLLIKMKDAGMADWIPTIEEVQAAWREGEKDGGE